MGICLFVLTCGSLPSTITNTTHVHMIAHTQKMTDFLACWQLYCVDRILIENMVGVLAGMSLLISSIHDTCRMTTHHEVGGVLGGDTLAMQNLLLSEGTTGRRYWSLNNSLNGDILHSTSIWCVRNSKASLCMSSCAEWSIYKIKK